MLDGGDAARAEARRERANHLRNIRLQKRRANGLHWTAEEEAIMRRMAREGATVEEIATATKRTRGAVWKRASRLHLRVIRPKYLRIYPDQITDAKSDDAALREESLRAGLAYSNAIDDAGGGSWGPRVKETYAPTARRYTPVTIPLTQSALGDL